MTSMSRLVSPNLFLAAAITSHALDHKMGSWLLQEVKPVALSGGVDVAAACLISRQTFRWAQHFYFPCSSHITGHTAFGLARGRERRRELSFSAL